jgi:hypothetical protein
VFCLITGRNKDEIAPDVLKEANVVVFGCPREKFSSSEVRRQRVSLFLCLAACAHATPTV